MLFILVGSFFILNLCVGVIVDNFGRMKAEGDGEFLLTDWQKAWIQMRKGVRTCPDRTECFGTS